MQAELTIYLAPPIVSEGGIVVLLPMPMEDSKFRLQYVKDGNEVVKINVEVSNNRNVIKFYYPQSSSNWNFQFDVRGDSIKFGPSIKTQLISFGSGNYYDSMENMQKTIQDINIIKINNGSKDEKADTKFINYFASQLGDHILKCRMFTGGEVCTKE